MPSITIAGQSRKKTDPASVNHIRIPAIAIDGVRLIATACPCVLPAAGEYARRFYPRSSLGRMA